MGVIIGVAILLLIIGLAIWAGRTKDHGTNGSNTDAARRYGSGYNG